MSESSRYERQIILKEIGRGGQARLEASRAAVIGLGALGSVSANLLARAGVGRLRIADRDFLEVNNLQRQVLYDEKDVAENLPKAIAAQRKLEAVNSEITIEAEVADVNALTVAQVLADVDLVIDGTDNFETRFLVNDFCLKTGRPWIYGGAIRTEGMAYVTLPGEGPCLRCLFGEAPAVRERETCDQVGILAPAAHMIASFQAMEAIKILAGKKEAVERRLWKMDLWTRQFKTVSVDHLKTAPCRGCRGEEYPSLDAGRVSQTVTLCGRDAVQISRAVKEDLDLGILASRLAPQARVEYNDFLLRFYPEPYEITVFPSGRAIVKGTEDAGRAKSLYSKYIGS